MTTEAPSPLSTSEALALFARNGERPTQAQSNLTLVRELAVTSFRLRYADSVLGYLWSLMRPVLMFGMLYIVFVLVLLRGRTAASENFPVELLVAIAAWTFFAEATSTSVSAIAANGDVLKKARFPRWVLVLAAVLSASMTLVVNFSLVIVIGIALHWYTIGTQTFVVLPLLLEFAALSIGLGFFLAAVYVRFRDLGYIWELALLLLFYGSGIIFPLSLVPARFQWLVMLNPVAQITEDLRHALVSPTIPWAADILGRRLVLPIACVLLSVVIGSFVFSRLAPRFGDHL